MTPPEFMQRQAAKVARPWPRLIWFHRVPAPNAKLRTLAMPPWPEGGQQATEAAVASECEAETVQAQGRPHRIRRARLPKRVLDVDMPHCPNSSSGALEIIAAIVG
jgi:hypothetical protein